jgi:trimeric autotransporter adhesin
MFILSIPTQNRLLFSMKCLFLLLFATVSTGVLVAQTDLKVGTTPGSISPSAVFEAASTTKGLLIPRVTTAQMNAIASPTLGLMVFNTDLNCLHFYFGGWKSQCDPTNLGAWSLLGNTNTTAATHFIGTRNAEDLVFKTNDTEGMRLGATGNLGIGNVSPSYKLDIVGSNPIRLIGLNAGAITDSIVSSNNGILRRLSIADIVAAGSNAWALTGNGGTNPSTNFLGTTDAQDMVFRSNSVERMRVLSGGNVGIGLTNPTRTLQVAGRVSISGTDGADRLYLWDTQNTLGTQGGLKKILNGGVGVFHGDATTGSAFNNPVMQVYRRNILNDATSDVTLFTILGQGNMGINTTTPQYKLDVDAITGSAGNPLRLLGLNAGNTADSIVTSNAGILRRLSINEVVGASGWLLNGNTLTGTTTIGSNSAHDVGIETDGITRLTISSAGAITQTGANQVTFTGNVDATNGLDVTTAALTANAGSTLTGATNINATGASATNIGNATSATTVLGATAINTTGAAATSIGNSGSAVTVAGTTGVTGATSINTTGAAATNIGNSGSTVTVAGTTSVTGTTTINTTGTAATTIGNSASNVTVAGTTSVTGATSINTSGASTTNVGTGTSSGTVTVGNTSNIVNIASDDVQMTNLPTTISVDNFLTINGSNQIEKRSIPNILTGTGVATRIAFWNSTSSLSSNADLYWDNTNGRLGVGTALPQTRFHLVNTSTADGEDDVLIQTFTNGGNTPAFIYNKAKGTQALPLTLGNSEYVGGLNGYAYNGSSFVGAGGVQSYTSSTFSTDGGTELLFLTGKNSTLNERARISKDGNFGINTQTAAYKLDIDAMKSSVGNPLRLQGLNAGASTDSILTSAAGVVRRLSLSEVTANAWNILGNGGTNPATNFLGTTDARDLVFRTNNTEGMRLSSAGKLGLGTNNPFSKLTMINSSSDDTEDDLVIRTFTNGTNQPAVVYQKARGTSALPLSLGNSELIGGTVSYAYDGTAFLRATAVQSYTSPTFTTDGGSDLLFYTGKNNTLSEIARVTATGNFGVNTRTPQYRIDIDAMVASVGNPLRLLGLNAGASTDSVLTSAAGVVRRQSVAEINASDWHITGNNNILDNATYFLGTSNDIPLNFRVNGQKAGRVGRSGDTYFGYQAGMNTTTADNTFIGSLAGTSNTLGDSNLGLGTQAMQNNTTGTYSVAVGYQALQAQSFSNGGAAWVAHNVAVGNRALWKNQPTSSGNGIYNTAIGNNTLYNNTTGAYNTAIGNSVLFNNTTANNNVGVGYYALNANTTGYQNVALGSNALAANTTGYANTGHGHQTLLTNTTGYENSAFGNSALLLNTTGSQNTANGTFSLRNNTVGSLNTAIGSGTMYNNTTASRNVAIGHDALSAQSFSNGGVAFNSDNIAIGFEALKANQPTSTTNGFQNVAIGTEALKTNTTGSNNVAIAPAALQTNSTGNQNVAIGQATLALNSTGSFNTAVGQSSMFNNVVGLNNTAIGTATLYNNTASNNVAIGNAMFSNTTGANNTATGFQTMNNFQTGSNNVANGYRAMAGSATPASNTGSNNTSIGYETMSTISSGGNNVALGFRAGTINQVGSNNTFIGYQADGTLNNLSNATAIGNGAVVDASNKMRLGNTSVTLVETYGTFVTVSDKRLKNNITDNAIGLNFIKAVRPVKYELNAQKGVMYDGFIAQEIDSILQKQNIKTFSGLSKPKNDSEHYSVSYSTFVVPLVNAVKELDEKNTQLATENEQLKAELAKMKAANSTLKASVEKNSQDIEAIKAMLDKKQ